MPPTPPTHPSPVPPAPAAPTGRPAARRAALAPAAALVALAVTLGAPSPALAVGSGTSPAGRSITALAADGVTPLAAPVGFGASTTGGAGGRVLHVTTAADQATDPVEGSLRWALQQPGPTWVVFDADMVVTLTAPLPVGSDTTIDGRGRQVVLTGPSGGGLEIHDVTNVVVENLTLTGFGDLAMTKANDPSDAISIQRASRVWIDHSTLSRAADKLIGATDGVRETTLSWNHFVDQQQAVQIGSMSTASNDVASTVTLAYNHFDHVGYRTPVVSYGKAHVFNNFIDTWSVSGVRSERLAQVYLEANVFVAGSAPKATIVTPAQECNDSGTLCDSRSGYLLDTGNLYLGKTRLESTGAVGMFAPSAAYSYTALPATVELAAAVALGAGAGHSVDLAAAVHHPPAEPTAKVRARNVKSGKDRLTISTTGAPAGLEATVRRRAGQDWKVVATVRLDERGRARVVVRDRAPGAVSKYVVDLARTDATLPSTSNVVALR